MDDAQREVLRYLFAMATALIEAAHDTAVTGQSTEMAAAAYAAAARRLQVVARDITALADAATVIADHRDEDPNDPNNLAE